MTLTAETDTAAVLASVAAGAAYLDAKLYISKDLNQLARAKRGQNNFLKAVAQSRASGFFLFEDKVQRYSEAQCIWSRAGEYTWRQAYERVCQYAHFFLNLGVQPKEYVAVYLYNSPEFLFTWMGLLAIGAAPSLINYNLAAEALVHCVTLSGTRFLLCDEATDCVARVENISDALANLGVTTIILSSSIRQGIAELPTKRPPVDFFHSKDVLPFALMFTSGTTGLPKAFPLSVDRNYPSASLTSKTFGQKVGPTGDRTYYCIPMYHGTGGIAAMNDLMSGISVAIAKKFSLSRFWRDCIDSQSTVFVYVGETVRYLLSAPPSGNDRKHKIRLIWGNGLAPDIWEKFQSRFGVPDIGEFFASTEGVMTLVNHYRSGFGLGAVGHHGWLLRKKYADIYVPVETDMETGDIWRSPESGFARRVPYQEGGEILVRLPSKSAWRGYWKADEATEKKLVRDVFHQGDLFYRTGDALRRDADGFWYFMDRLGDTYRWKGENVSTTEVSQVFGTFNGMLEANVYGVKLPNHDGRAGCAAVVLDTTPDTFPWAALTAHLRSKLPFYAIPVFIRVRKQIGSMNTDNNKHNKVPLRLEGVNVEMLGKKVPGGNEDVVYWLPPKATQYVPFTKQHWQGLSSAEVRL
ncbi:long-chain fatty acid transporter fat1 [Emydomyces testavorans]|uniref:Very long-chain fatty acid transport protein n=1 Tax=Emydomyces testavorans TaxID=2070801 RepID=A0AAF0DAU3_9EURO|nr:long-chain fatty acid transporter fat1 [Emydomyces testavorans]